MKLLVLLLFFVYNPVMAATDCKLIIPNGILPNSLDPLHCDQFNNYFQSQLLYLTPLAVSHDGRIGSFVADSFQYDQDKNTLTLRIKENLKFSDQSVLSEHDIAFAIARLLYSRPSFPVLRDIAGISEWLKLKNPLHSYPSGIIVGKKTVQITFNRKMIEPLFRFTMTPLSIIPKDCVDLDTNTIKCKSIPTSGFYTKEASNPNEQQLHYKLRREYSDTKYPESITLSFPKADRLSTLLSSLNKTEVLFIHDFDFEANEFKSITKDFLNRRLGSAWFSSLVLNPRVKPFDKVECRRVFADIFYDNFKKQDLGLQSPSRSLFTKLVPGYLNDSHLIKESKVSAKQLKSCRNQFLGKKYTWGHRKSNVPSYLNEALRLTAKELGFDLSEPELAKGSHTGWPSYESKNVLFQTSYSGFWPLDPMGDIQMLFTPKLHEDYMDIWSDHKMIKLLDRLSQSNDLMMSQEIMKNINMYLFNESIMIPISHLSYSFISLKDNKSSPKLSAFELTVPYPWDVF